MAGILERVDWSNILFIQSHGQEAPKPVKVHRPWSAAEEMEVRKQSTPEELRKFFGAAARVEKK